MDFWGPSIFVDVKKLVCRHSHEKNTAKKIAPNQMMFHFRFLIFNMF